MKIKFIVLKNDRDLPLGVSSQKIIDMLPYLKCGWCYTCMENFLYCNYFEDHKDHNLLFAIDDAITKICWITQNIKINL
jgi:hypothetical protein